MQDYNQRLKRLMVEAIKELNSIDIKPSSKIMKISGNGRAKKRLGCCKAIREKHQRGFTIEISNRLNEQKDSIIKGIIIHELLHTCPGCMNHGKKWKMLAACVHERLGYTIKTTANFEEFGLKDEGSKRPYKYEIECEQCDGKMFRMKKCPLVMEPMKYRCSKCGGNLIVKKII